MVEVRRVEGTSAFAGDASPHDASIVPLPYVPRSSECVLETGRSDPVNLSNLDLMGERQSRTTIKKARDANFP